MTSREKQMILAKLQELVELAKGIAVQEEATLFSQVDENPILQPTSFTPTAVHVKDEKVTRRRIKDGSMTASMLSSRLSKEFGRPVSRSQITKVAKSCNAEAYYNESQHESRYTPESVTMIIALFRSIL